MAEKLRAGEAVDVSPRSETEWKGERISLSFRAADLKEVLRFFAEIAEVNLVIDPAVEGTVTLELEDVPWDQALYVILRSHGLSLASGERTRKGKGLLWNVSSRAGAGC